MYKYEGLVVDGDGQYFAMFKYHNKTWKRRNHIIYDLPGLMYLIQTDSGGHIDQDSLLIARTLLLKKMQQQNQKERAI